MSVDETIDKFMLITDTEDRNVAVDILNISNWDLEEAVLYYFESQEVSNMENSDGPEKTNQLLGEEETVVEREDSFDHKDLNKDFKNDRAQQTEGDLLEEEGEEQKELRGKSIHKEKKDETLCTEKQTETGIKLVEENNERRKSEENIENTNKENEKIKRETTFLGILRPVVSLVSPLFKNVGNLIAVILKFLGAFLLSTYTANDFISSYERKYGTFHVNFFKGSFKKAVLEAKQSGKLLVIYCHMETEGNYFCERIFTDPKAKDFIDANFIVYADYVTCAKVPVIKMMRTKIAFPALLVVMPLEESNVKLLKYMNERPSVSHIIDMLTGCIEYIYLTDDTLSEQHILEEDFQNGNVNLRRNGAELHSVSPLGGGLGSSFVNRKRDPNVSSTNPVNAELGRVGQHLGQTAPSNDSRSGLVKRNVSSAMGINLRTNRTAHITFRAENIERNITDRLIREEQDREYQEALLIDQMKEEQKKEEERLKRLKSDVKKDIKEDRKKRSQNFQLKINEGESTTKICSRFPNGKRIQRDFSVEHTIQNIYEWVECSEFLEKDITVPYKFELICSHSKMVLEKNDKPIKDFDLIPNAILNVKSLDSSDEE